MTYESDDLKGVWLDGVWLVGVSLSVDITDDAEDECESWGRKGDIKRCLNYEISHIMK